MKAKATIAAAAGTVALLTGTTAMLTGTAHAGTAHAASAAPAPAVRIGGMVHFPSTDTSAQLARSFPQSAFTATDGKSRSAYKGIALATLVNKAVPAYPKTLMNKTNPQLRVTVTVTGASGYQVTFALGELLHNYGSHPAYLALTQAGKQISGGPELVVPGDKSALRWMHQVRGVTIGISTLTATDNQPPAGSPVQVIDGGPTATLTSAQIASLPKETFHMSISAMHGMEKKTETGPSLLSVLRLARVKLSPDTWVAAVGSDNYTAIVTPDEQVVGGRKLQLSQVENGARLAQPRLVPYGDFYADRFVFGVVDLYVGTGPVN